MALSTPLASVIYGHAYASSGGYLLILAVVSLFTGVGNLSWSPFLYGVGETRRSFLATAAGSIASIIASIILVFYVGVYGVIIGTLVGQIISLLIASRYISEILETSLETWSVWRIYLASAVSAVIVYPVSLVVSNPFLAVILGGVIFLLILFPIMAITRALTRRDVSDLQTRFKDVRPMRLLLGVVAKYHGLFVKEVPEQTTTEAN